MDSYHAEIEAFRQARLARLTSDVGWLTIAGLHFLTEVETTVGSAAENDVVLPAGAPAHLGTFVLAKDGAVSVELRPGTTVSLLDGRPFAGGPIRSDGAGPPDRLVLGDVQLWIHQSGKRPAIRVRDKNHFLRREFAGVKWYPVKETYRVEGTFEPFDTPRELNIPNVLGDIETMTAPGHVRFTLHEREFRMLAVSEGAALWFIFRDLTSDGETYPAGRFLYTSRAEEGLVTLDFNRAENPPCAFSPFATCPLPPAENRLQTRIEAGEMYARPASGG
ncbi:MAG TPA: DUF1684 domain-containing protein [Terriglobia bacterium]|nr:DUF1684 domain-containing protein [Terriglobia bacterium]